MQRELDVYGWAAVGCTDTELVVVNNWVLDMLTPSFMLLPLVEAPMKVAVGYTFVRGSYGALS